MDLQARLEFKRMGNLNSVHLSSARYTFMRDTFRLERNGRLLLCSLIVLHLAGWLAMKPLWPSSDDLQYALNAVCFHAGKYHPGMSQFENRPGLFIPAALFIRVFGLSPFSISAWPLLLSSFSIALVFVVSNSIWGLGPAFISGFLVATNTFQLSWSLELYPDMPLAFFSMLIVCALYFARTGSDKTQMKFWLVYVCAGVWAFLNKEAILLLAPFIGLVFLEDLLKNRHMVFWKNMLIYTCLAIFVILSLYVLWTGDPFHRLRSMYDFGTQHLIAVEDEHDILVGSPRSLPSWLVSNLGYIFLLVFSIPAWIFFKKGKNPFLTWILQYSLVMFIEFSILFHSHKFGVVFMQARLWMCIVMPLAILAAAVIQGMNRNAIRVICTLLFLLCIYNYVTAGSRRAFLFLLFELVTLSSIFFYERMPLFRYVVLLPFLILYISFIYFNSNWGLKMQKRPLSMVLPALYSGSDAVKLSCSCWDPDSFSPNQMVISSSMCFFNPCPRVTRPRRLFPE
jgi:hypothetical protein